MNKRLEDLIESIDKTSKDIVDVKIPPDVKISETLVATPIPPTNPNPTNLTNPIFNLIPNMTPTKTKRSKKPIVSFDDFMQSYENVLKDFHVFTNIRR